MGFWNKFFGGGEKMDQPPADENREETATNVNETSDTTEVTEENSNETESSAETSQEVTEE